MLLRTFRWLAVCGICVSVAMQAQEQGCKSTVVGRLEIFPVVSKVFHNTRMLRVWLPPGYGDAANAGKKYKVMYMLDGQSVFDACTAFEHEEMSADETLTELITKGKIEPIIAVGVDNGGVLNAKGENDDNGLERGREYLPYPDSLSFPQVMEVAGAEFPRFMETEVMPAVEAKYRVLKGRANTAIEGASYGGVAALWAMAKRPDLFGMGSVESPSVQAGNGQIIRDTKSLLLGPSRLALGVGTDEVSGIPDAALFNAMLIKEVKALADNFESAAFKPTKVQVTVGQGARHSTKYFGERFAAALTFLYGTAEK
jgi:predicted alpha/beta superfamily hydrolase